MRCNTVGAFSLDVSARAAAGFALGLVLLLAAACSGSDRSGPGQGGSLEPPASGVIVVEAGDSVSAIARRYQVPMQALIVANGLTAPYTLRIGQRLRLPPGRTHRVVAGDTVYRLARRYDVDIRSLVTLNRLDPPYHLTAGQLLALPATRQPDMASPPPLPEPRPSRQAARVVPSERPRPPARETVAAVRETAPPVSAEAPAPPASATPEVRSAATAEQKAPAPALQPPPRGASRFMWPVRGRVISDFGPGEGGRHNDGINIAAPRGAPIIAADNGVVAYVGAELPGFGNLLLIRHAGGWTTAYAHADRLLVSRGDIVRRGQTVATIGKTGDVDRPQLHFEIRRGSRAIDPRDELES